MISRVRQPRQQVKESFQFVNLWRSPWINNNGEYFFYDVRCTMYAVRCTLYAVRYTLYAIRYNIQCTIYNIQCTMYNVRYTMRCKISPNELNIINKNGGRSVADSTTTCGVVRGSSNLLAHPLKQKTAFGAVFCYFTLFPPESF